MRKVHSLFMAVMTGVVFLLLTVSVQAISLGFDPVDQEVESGDLAYVDLVISGLGNGMADSLSTFDLNIDFDATILSFYSVIFGDQLDLMGKGSKHDRIPGTGTVNLYELSVDSKSLLDNNQKSAFTLATLTFNTLSIGTSPLTMRNIILGDTSNPPETIDIIDSPGSITVLAPIPEPATMLLFSTGILLLSGLRRRSGKKNQIDRNKNSY